MMCPGAKKDYTWYMAERSSTGNVTEVSDEMVYVSILETIQVLLRNDAVVAEVQS
jgi:hypothetical protein